MHKDDLKNQKNAENDTNVDEIHSDEIIPEDETENIANTLKKLRDKLKICEKEKMEYLSGWQRAKADLVNTRKEHTESINDLGKFAITNFIEDLIPVLDSFSMAFGNKSAWESVPANWRNGVEYIHSQLISVLRNHQVKEISPDGEPFDPKIHHSVGLVETEDTSLDGKIASVLQKGYEISGKLIRPPNVKVFEYKK